MIFSEKDPHLKAVELEKNSYLHTYESYDQKIWKEGSRSKEGRTGIDDIIIAKYLAKWKGHSFMSAGIVSLQDCIT